MKLPDCVGCARPAGRGRASRARTGSGLRSGAGRGGGPENRMRAREAARRALRIIKPRQLVPEKRQNEIKFRSTKVSGRYIVMARRMPAVQRQSGPRQTEDHRNGIISTGDNGVGILTTRMIDCFLPSPEIRSGNK